MLLAFELMAVLNFEISLIIASSKYKQNIYYLSTYSFFFFFFDISTQGNKENGFELVIFTL
jgi:hypothetical protein